jgi:hypothetical protein
MAYGIRLDSGQVQLLTGTTVLTNQQADGLLGGGAALVWIDANGEATPLDVLLQEYDDDDFDEEDEK